MRFQATAFAGVVTIEPQRHLDERGWFSRIYCREEFAEHGLDFDPVQESLSFNERRGTRRGLHYQAAPRWEPKLVRCTRGSAFDVVVDIRPDSESFGRWISVDLSADNGRAVLIPGGFAHGFQTLEDATELLYLMSEPYDADLQRGVHADDPELAVAWPSVERLVVSERDRQLPLLRKVPRP